MRTLLLLAIFGTAVTIILCGAKGRSCQSESTSRVETVSAIEADSVSASVFNFADAS